MRVKTTVKAGWMNANHAVRVRAAVRDALGDAGGAPPGDELTVHLAA